MIIGRHEWVYDQDPDRKGVYETLTPVKTARGVQWVVEQLRWTGHAWNDERYPITDIKAWRRVSAWRSQTYHGPVVILMEDYEPECERAVCENAERTFSVKYCQ